MFNIDKEIERLKSEGKLSEKDAAGLKSYWKEINGDEYAGDMVKNPTEASAPESGTDDTMKAVVAAMTPEERKIFAGMTDSQKKEFVNYWGELLPKDFAKAQAEDYSLTGKPNKKTAGKAEDASFVEAFWGPLYGSTYAKDMTGDYVQKKNITKR